MGKPTNVFMMHYSELDDFVRNKAKPGDIAIYKNQSTKQAYMFHSTHENIGENANPHWVMIDEKMIWKNYFENMSLEEKVNFLIENYIQNIT